jgi:hypothetical protein
MIKVGDIVFKKYVGGIVKDKTNTKEIGLVIKEFKEPFSVSQYYVSFNQKDPKWFYQHEIQKIIWNNKDGEKNA